MAAARQPVSEYPVMEDEQSQAPETSYTHSEAEFERAFKTHFRGLHAYAFTFLRDRDTAEDMVQTVFFKLWEKAGMLRIQGPISAYLYRSVYYACLNHLKHQKVKEVHRAHVRHAGDAAGSDAGSRMDLRQLENRVAHALQELPEGCRTVFQLSRFESLKYQEIAERLGISVKTVENQMGKALRLLRVRLADFLPLILGLTLQLWAEGSLDHIVNPLLSITIS